MTRVMVIPPARSIPKRIEAKIQPPGWSFPTKPTAIPSHPYPGENPSTNRPCTPNISPPPPMPAIKPLRRKAKNLAIFDSYAFVSAKLQDLSPFLGHENLVGVKQEKDTLKREKIKQ